jgi:putative FmdB family regulatory protein
MPTYDYKCLDCGDTFEFFQRMSDEPLSECPKCKGKLKRLIGTGLRPIFKGSGFYETDYKSGGSKEKTSPKPEKTSSNNAKKDSTKKSA